MQRPISVCLNRAVQNTITMDYIYNTTGDTCIRQIKIKVVH